jgi:hypothetical protein
MGLSLPGEHLLTLHPQLGLGCLGPGQRSWGHCLLGQVSTEQQLGHVGAVLEVLGGKGEACHRQPLPPTGTHPVRKEGTWLHLSWARCQACWSRPAPQALVGP